ncbi:50S ribosomal protein L3 [Candidatus Marsarchaeota archaeon]|jgi:large subunit ribosomal protein L3|nr:50S ribosomal protein L3 [Candidatus Marsarchaeota archaeon]MCL5100008.1 50S ribosomal protein L3 [Candidatus Marsarchaeota archaeon]
MAGSLQYWPRRRARHRLPRIRNSPILTEPALSGIIAYKAGMVSLGVVDDSNSPTKGMEVMRAGTVLEIPKMEVYGIRLYKRDANSGYRGAATEVLHRQASERLGIKKVKADETKLADLKAKAGEYGDATALVAAYPKGMSVGQHHTTRFESAVGGKSVEEKLDTLSKLLGKELKASDVFKPGEYIDTISITKGKGWQGAIKRFGASRQFHKATQKIRHVGPIGAFTPGKVLYSVPRAGQMGFNYRTEQGKRILKIGQKESAHEINPKSGFANYGQVRNDYVLIEGSVPGAAKRLVRIRKSISGQGAKGANEPKLTFITG